MIRIGAFTLPAHFVFETLAYLVGYRVYLAARARESDPIPDATRLTLVVAAAVGAALGSKLLVWAQNAPALWAARGDVAAWAGGKTIVGGLLGGWLMIEVAKRSLGERRRTGDVYVIPLCVGIAIGRVGCFLAGLDDHTYGDPTRLPWGVDFGDGIPRHPAQLYEIAALVLIAAWARSAQRRIARGRLTSGDAFRGFMTQYLAFRLALEAIKPGPKLLPGLSAIQIACVLGLVYLVRDWPRVFFRAAAEAAPAPESGMAE